MAYPLSGLLSSQLTVLESLPKAFVAIYSSEDYSISSDSASSTIFTGITGDNDNTPVLFEIESDIGAVRNVSGRELLACTGVMSLHMTSSNSSASTLYVYSETSSDDGVTWVKNLNSGRKEIFTGNDESYQSKSSQFFNIPDDGLIRFMAFSDSSSLSSTQVSFTADGETVTGPSFRLWVKEL